MTVYIWNRRKEKRERQRKNRKEGEKRNEEDKKQKSAKDPKLQTSQLWKVTKRKKQMMYVPD